jgi:hypothetical protein
MDFIGSSLESKGGVKASLGPAVRLEMTRPASGSYKYELSVGAERQRDHALATLRLELTKYVGNMASIAGS